MASAASNRHVSIVDDLFIMANMALEAVDRHLIAMEVSCGVGVACKAGDTGVGRRFIVFFKDK